MLADLQLMDNFRLGQVLETYGEVVSENLVEESGMRWVLAYRGRRLLVVTDEVEDRMRVMTPVARYSDMTDRDVRVVLGANFDRTLDSRYATAGGYLWAAYLHPLAELTERQVAEGLRQVATLADNYGGSYAVGDHVFTGGE